MRTVRNARVRESLRLVWSWQWLAVAVALIGTPACRHARSQVALSPPSGAAEWSSEYADLYDDGLTSAPLRFDGRAPNDVLDQNLFQRRLGHSDLVALVRVEQVWGRGRYQGVAQQFVEVTMGEILLGELPRSASERQMLRVVTGSDLPGSLPGHVMILFVRWAPGLEPPFHHHLVMAHRDAIRLIEAMTDHARAEGKLGRDGTQSRRQRRKRKRAAATEEEGE